MFGALELPESKMQKHRQKDDAKRCDFPVQLQAGVPVSFVSVQTYDPGMASLILKILIIVLFIANLVALGSAFYTLLVDQGRGGKRTANLLLLRVSLAALLLLVIGIGIWSGLLNVSAPWQPAGQLPST